MCFNLHTRHINQNGNVHDWILCFVYGLDCSWFLMPWLLLEFGREEVKGIECNIQREGGYVTNSQNTPHRLIQR